MINVVFLLLVFFVMTAELGPTPPFEVTPPTGGAEPSTVAGTLFVAADGSMAFAELTGQTAFAAAASVSELTLTVDQGFDGAELASLVADLSARGVTSILLSVRAP